MLSVSLNKIFPFYDQFKQISVAYEVLSDTKKREIYDRGGEEAIKSGGSHDGGCASPMDIFDMFCHDAGGRWPAESKNVIQQMNVTLDELYCGSTRKLALQKKVICPKCNGWYDVKIIKNIYIYRYYRYIYLSISIYIYLYISNISDTFFYCLFITNKVKKNLFNETRQYNMHIFYKIIFLRYWTKQIKATETNK